jgi:hypothetical protein
MGGTVAAVKRGLHAALACAVIAACIEPRSAFEPTDRIPLDGLVVRLTYNPGDDRTPSWLDDSTILYVAEGYEDVSRRGVPVAIPVDASAAARPLLEGLPPMPWILAPRQGASGDVVYLEPWDMRPTGVCWEIPVVIECELGEFLPVAPIIFELRYRTRPPGSTRGMADDPMLRLTLPGYDYAFPPGAPWYESLDMYPAFTLYATEGTHHFRPDWSPDGQRIVLSDGLRLFIWTPATAEFDEIPGTDDGISPAWSPNGEWIAYTRLIRGDSTDSRCAGRRINVAGLTGPVCTIDQKVVQVAARLLVLTRPDGSQEYVLGAGEDAAWAPDGTLYFRHDDQLWRYDETPAPIPGTVGAREPAISPDGKRIVFAFRNATGKHDLWVRRLED